MLKRMLRSEAGSAVVSWVLAKYIWLTARSIRWRMATPEAHAKATEPDQPIIAVFWHSRIIQMNASWRESKPIAMLQSPHPDGKLIARAIQRLGYQTIWGSSTKGKGGAAGLRNMIKALRGGLSVGITPDGPRGPRMRLSAGVVAMARLSGAPVMPVAWNVKHRKTLRTWDRMLLARPFSRGVVFWGEPIYVPKSLTPEEFEDYRLLIETRLTEVTDQADLYFGYQPTTPADPAEEPGKRNR
ncbi:MAG: lysophospholipid acyltransferase family protein [Proteobacteria bacterium]|nr:lysophospholipid acyltransferase family protein [Pseudomonadota bacterium]MDA1309444.1 lysophospholipid acyltransferase family protein [Pseudomonadota bacterium]